MRRRVHAEEHTGELNIVPYLDVVVNLVMFMLLSMTGLISLGVLNVTLPPIATESAAAAETSTPLTLAVGIDRTGFTVSGAEGVLPSIPLKKDKDGKDQYDYGALNELMVKIKDKYPTETQVTLAPDAYVLYDTLIQTMDACREQVVKKPNGDIERKALFFDVGLGEFKKG